MVNKVSNTVNKVSKTVMIDQYFDFYKQSILDYGERTCVLMKVGGFWECYSIINEKEDIGNAKEIAEIIHCEFSNKNKVEKMKTGYSSRSFPDFFGFNLNSLTKYTQILINAGYTVVKVDQIGEIVKGQLAKREITNVSSSTLKLPEYEINGDSETNLVGVLMEFVNGMCLYSICNVNNVTNNIEVMESGMSIGGDSASDSASDSDSDSASAFNLDEISRILLRINIKELQLNVINNISNIDNYLGKLTSFFKEYTSNFRLNVIDTNSDNVGNKTYSTYKNYIKPHFQNEFLANIYKNVSFGLLSPLEYLELSQRQLCTVNLLYIYDFIGKHDKLYLSNLSIPKIIEDNDHLVLALNTSAQLNISQVFDTVNFTNTAIGRRYLKSLLCKPFKDPEIINKRLNLTEELKQLNVQIDIKLKSILDFERLHRKMSLESLRPFEFEKLHMVYNLIKELIYCLTGFSIIPSTLLKELNEYIDEISDTFNLNLLKTFNGTTIINFFNTNVVPELDIIEKKLIDINNDVEKIRLIFDSSINDTQTQQVKLDSTEADGLFFTCTKIRFEKLKEKLKKKYDFKTFKIKTSGSTVKFSDDQLNKLSFGLLNNRDLLNKQTNLHFQNKLKNFSQKYNKLFSELTLFVQLLDVTNSNLKCSLKYNYTKPILINNSDDSAFIDCKDIRHPIIERLSETEYITNNIILNNTNNGMLVYGINSCGKSSLLRSVGVNLILAQCGLYTASTCFKFSPFSTLISQVDLTDNLFSGKSSFVSEMSGLKKILSCAGKNTLCLSDELCKGTESSSAEAIVSATIMHLIETGTKFFFTSHLHGIPKIERIKTQKGLQIKHLSVTIKGEQIIFDRKLKDTSGPDIYGLEVAKNIIGLPDFINNAFEIRNEINGTCGIKSKKSNYNKKKIMTSCEVCQFIPKKNEIPLETHHIKEQQETNEKGFFQDVYFHKNNKFNLVTLCKSCHQKIDTKELVIYGYKSSVSGVFLDFKTFAKLNVVQKD